MSVRISTVQNFLMPADGQPAAFVFNETLVAGREYVIDFRNVNLDGQAFWPYGVYIDNYDGTDTLIIRLDQLGLRIRTGANDTNVVQYPGVEQQSVTISGEGPVNIVFVNYPVF